MRSLYSEVPDDTLIDFPEIPHELLMQARKASERQRSRRRMQARRGIEQYFENKALHYQIADGWALEAETTERKRGIRQA
jgi:hypothetical protein